MKTKEIGHDPLLHAQPLSLYTHNEQERLRIKRRHLSKYKGQVPHIPYPHPSIQHRPSIPYPFIAHPSVSYKPVEASPDRSARPSNH